NHNMTHSQSTEVKVLSVYRPLSMTATNTYIVYSLSTNIVPISVDYHAAFGPLKREIIDIGNGAFAEEPQFSENGLELKAIRILSEFDSSIKIQAKDASNTVPTTINLKWKTNSPPVVKSPSEKIIVRAGEKSSIFLKLEDRETPVSELG